VLKSSHGGAVALCLWNLSTHPDRARLGPASQYLSLFSLFTNFLFLFLVFITHARIMFVLLPPRLGLYPRS